ncbi:MAG: hypothetical protein ACJ72E_06515 [Marmoricola sp.]
MQPPEHIHAGSSSPIGRPIGGGLADPDGRSAPRTTHPNASPTKNRLVEYLPARFSGAPEVCCPEVVARLTQRERRSVSVAYEQANELRIYGLPTPEERERLLPHPTEAKARNASRAATKNGVSSSGMLRALPFIMLLAVLTTAAAIGRSYPLIVVFGLLEGFVFASLIHRRRTVGRWLNGDSGTDLDPGNSP